MLERLPKPIYFEREEFQSKPPKELPENTRMQIIFFAVSIVNPFLGISEHIP